MKNRNVELINIARIDLLKGKTNINLDSLSQILLDNYATKFDKKDLSFYYEDSYCPPNEYVDTIIEEMKTDFFAATQEKIEVTNYWGHIHEKNMSTSLHNHDNSYVSVVVYLKIPGELVEREYVTRILSVNNADVSNANTFDYIDFQSSDSLVDIQPIESDNEPPKASKYLIESGEVEI